MVKTGRFASTTMQTMPPPGWQLVPVGTAAKPKEPEKEPVTKMIYEKRESIVEERRVSKVSGAGVVDVKKTHRMHSEMRVVQRR
ncbi:unnamed protein product [Sphagnum compactum]